MRISNCNFEKLNTAYEWLIDGCTSCKHWAVYIKLQHTHTHTEVCLRVMTNEAVHRTQSCVRPPHTVAACAATPHTPHTYVARCPTCTICLLSLPRSILPISYLSVIIACLTMWIAVTWRWVRKKGFSIFHECVVTTLVLYVIIITYV